jgi:signal transduction histidine kinase
MTAGFALLIGLLMLAVCGAFYLYNTLADRRDADNRLALTSHDIQRELLESVYDLDNPAQLFEEEEDELRAANVVVLILDENQRVVGASQERAPQWPLAKDEWRASSFAMGDHTIVVCAPWRARVLELRRETLLLLLLSAVVVALSSMAAWNLVGRTLAPIDQLARQAQAASAESLHVRLGAPSPDTEITRLVSTLNELLGRLERTAAARGRFYAAASHELRTPLQALTGHLEVALSRPRGADDYRGALDESRSQAERLTTLVQDLLLLNQLDADTSRPPAVLLDLVDICENELKRQQPVARQRGLHFQLSLPESCEITAPWSHIEMLIRNLLENCVKYATPEGLVRVQLRGRTLKLYNDSPPIAGWDPDKYFEPFFRPDASRNSQTGGNGLGLAICKAICDTNGWTIELQPDASGVTVTVCFGEKTP